MKLIEHSCSNLENILDMIIIIYKGAVAHGRVPSQKIALNKSQEDIFYTNT